MPEIYKEAICPVCGRAAGKLYSPKPWAGGEKVTPKEWRKIKKGMEPVDYFTDYIVPGYDIDRDYWGIIRSTGAGKMEIVGYLENPSDDPEMFEGVKEALKLAITHYYRRGWLTEADIQEAVERT